MNQEEQPGEEELFTRAAELFGSLDNRSGLAEALFWLGTYRQTVRGDTDAAVSSLLKSYQLATDTDAIATLASAARHLGFAAVEAGRWDDARSYLEESLRLGNQPAIAAAVLALAELAVSRGDRAEALRPLNAAARIASDAEAGRIVAAIDEARTSLGPTQ